MVEQIVVAVGETGYMTKQSRTPRRASGTFVPPLASAVAPRRSPHLLAKRRHQHPEPSSCAEGENSQLPVLGGTVSTLVWQAIRKRVGESLFGEVESLLVGQLPGCI